MQPGNTCNNCNVLFNVDQSISNGTYFITASVVNQLKDLFEKHDLKSFLVQDRYSEGSFSDIFDGNSYKKHADFFQNCDNLSFTWNTDGVPVFSSSNFSIWPVLISINEVQADHRSEFVMLHSLWFGKEKPNISTFLQPFVSEMNQLYNIGVSWLDSDDTLHTTRCLTLVSSVDTVARAMLQKVKQFNGKYGCGFCLHPGERVPKGRGSTMVYELKSPLPTSRTHENMLQHGEEALATGQPVFGVSTNIN